MPDFSIYTNYTEKTSFSEVVMGNESPVLEVEINELQEIVNTKVKRLAQVFGACVTPFSNGSITFNESDKKVTLTNCIALSGEFSAFIPSASVVVSDTKKIAYVKLEKVSVTGNSTLKEYGNTDGSNLANPIIDNRVGKETTRRNVIKFTVIAGVNIPSDTDTIKYVRVGEFNSKTFKKSEDRITKLENQLNGLIFTIENGVLYVDDGQ